MPGIQKVVLRCRNCKLLFISTDRYLSRNSSPPRKVVNINLQQSIPPPPKLQNKHTVNIYILQSTSRKSTRMFCPNGDEGVNANYPSTQPFETVSC
ncbi:hypothetical protein CDAR_36901 [Caerostris darwini]|uniref:Uncharacterized protein n=1 Tax=Caerostris darwini TaxID=1538125 RepID=A0AAV4UVA8_9ARAC|nr:hypothetical protein CDAR_36901 [Caerostris darwini]